MARLQSSTLLHDLVPERSLGSGKSSRVLSCTRNGERFALKLASPELDVNARALFAAEARCMAWTRSRSLPSLRATGVLPRELSVDGVRFAAKTPCLLLDLIDGEPLFKWWTQPDDPHALAWAVARDVGEALWDLHSAGFAHGDVKPENILVRRTSAGLECTLIDLGLADSASRTKPKGGTRRYLAPETWHDEQDGNGRSRDVFALGLTLLETLVPAAREDPKPTRWVGELGNRERTLIGALSSEDPTARPLASWVYRQCPGTDAPETRAARGRQRARQSYLLLRKRELGLVERGQRARVELSGCAGAWLSEQVATLEQIRNLLGIPDNGGAVTLGSLSEHQQRKWLLSLVGTDCIDFPPLPDWSDDELAERLLELTRDAEPESLTYGTLVAGSAPQRLEPPRTPIDVALRLGEERPDESTLEAVEALVADDAAAESMVLKAARALKRKNETARALTLLNGLATPGSRLERAGILLRAGQHAATAAELDRLAGEPLSERDACEVRAMRARMALAEGDTEAARDALNGAAPAPAVLEARASLHLTRGDLREAEMELQRALSHPHDAEHRARIEALFANLEQHRGNSELALERFRSAAEHAARAGAILEEATYLIGVAGNASNLGQLQLALSASRRSELLFEHLEQPSAAARAALSSAAAFATANAQAEAEEACQRTLQLARLAGDARCRAYAHVIASELSEADDALEHLERAAKLLDPIRPSDALRLAARRLRREAPLSDSIADLDQIARDATLDERLEWWAARGEAALREHDVQNAKHVLSELTKLAHRDAAPDALGPAMAFGAQLAAETGDGETARMLLHAATAALSKLVRGTPAALRSRLGQKAWVKLVRAPTEQTHIALEQVYELEALIHALSERDRLKPLLERVLDALVLWTGVERGLLLLKAPGGKLVPRAARNIARRELNPLQVELSRSLAERALSSSECVVAVDAAGELPELHESVHALKLRSILAVPLMTRGEVLGVVYLDDRIRRGAFGPRELSWVKLVAALASVAIADAKTQLSLRRAARKATRAEARLAETLAERNAQLEVAERELAKSRDANRFAYPEIVGRSAPIREMLSLVDRITVSEIPVLIFGESGSGKELVARAIAKNGPRAKRPFVSENCSAIPETLLESTLFGHVKGAFTGASQKRIGLFEAADGGTLFLDEIADMSLNMQAKLLRSLESGEIRRVGDERPVAVDVRVIGATHKNLEELVRTGAFREDLMYRLNVINVSVPPLRDRAEDVPALVEYFLDKHGSGAGLCLSRAALELLCGYSWPGNVRQLENETRRAMVLADSEIRPEHFSNDVQLAQPRRLVDGLNLRSRVDALETQLVTRALSQTEGNQTRASKLLGVSRFGLQKMMRRLGIDVSNLPSSSQ